MKIKYRTSAATVTRYFHLAAIITISLLNGCSSSFNDQFSPQNLISANSIKANLEFLASDELEGREAATRGEKLAALFISSELKKYGLKPFYGDYLQGYELNSVSADSESVVDILNINEDKITLNYLDDFIADRRSSISAAGKYKLVFAGFGITAPEFNYNDYTNLDVEGKIVVIADGEPYSSDTSYFDGEKKSKYSRDSFKVTLAKNSGAAGLITIPSDFYLNNWERIKNFSRGESVSFPNKKREKLLNLIFNEKSLSILFKDEKFSFDEIKNMIKDKTLPVFDMDKEIEIEVKINDEIKYSYNVVGIIEGNDPQKKHEYVSIGAHYDHLGIQDGKVYNGADDNGSGTAALLEVAHAFAKTKSNDRSILVVFHGAEEKGLLGSEYFTDKFKDIENIIAHINMDMVGREHIDTIYSVGSGKISPQFQKLIEEVNSETVNFVFNYKFDDPSDRQKIYYRSDHYNYAKHGIPIVFFYDYMMDDYHKDSDETDKINFEKIRKTAILVYNIALRTANLSERLKSENKEVLQSAN
jgi:hypothetical protein